MGGWWVLVLCRGFLVGASVHEAGGLRGTDWGFSWLPGPVCLGFLWGSWHRAGACWAFLSCSFVGFFFFLGGRVPNWGFSIVCCVGSFWSFYVFMFGA